MAWQDAYPQPPVSPDSSPAGEPYPRPGRPFKRRWLPVYGLVMMVALGCLHFGRDYQACQRLGPCFSKWVAIKIGSELLAFKPFAGFLVRFWMLLAFRAHEGPCSLTET